MAICHVGDDITYDLNIRMNHTLGAFVKALQVAENHPINQLAKPFVYLRWLQRAEPSNRG